MTGEILISVYIFVLAIFVGFEVITKVPPLLHTPLMSGSNAISGITLVGALLSAGKGATIYADGHLYLRSEAGPVALIEATPDGLKEKSRFDQPDRSDKQAWPHPVIANGKLYLRDQGLLLCYDVRGK